MKPGIDFIGVGAGTFILNERNEVLLMKRSSQSKNKKGYWTIPGGKVELWETVQDTAKREAKEEVGVDVEILHILCITNDIMHDENQHWVTPSFLCKIISGEPKIMEQKKCDALQWFSLHQLPEPLTQPTRDAVEAYLKQK